MPGSGAAVFRAYWQGGQRQQEGPRGQQVYAELVRGLLNADATLAVPSASVAAHLLRGSPTAATPTTRRSPPTSSGSPRSATRRAGGWR
jgi:hypothetical protein